MSDCQCPRVRRLKVGLLGILITIAIAAPAASQSLDEPGIATTQPESGPFVDLGDGRYMIPYSATIPGTDVSFEMIPIPGGEFLLGSPPDEEFRRDDEGPQVRVTVEPFWMGKYEVTWAEYETFMRLDAAFKTFNFRQIRPVNDSNKADAVTAPSSLYDPTFTFDAGGEPDQPAATMTQFAAKQYTKFLSLLTGTFYRLPTEMEWEYAARGGTTTAYYFGDDDSQLRRHAWFSDNADDERHTVGKRRPNPFGLHDIYGNVAEWVLDAYSPDGYLDWAARENVMAHEYRRATKVHPRVLRGGSYELDAEDARSAARMPSADPEWKLEDPNFPRSPWWFTDSPATGIGFRLLRPVRMPESREAMFEYWNADVPDILLDVENRIRDNGRGAWGIVDPGLPQALEQIRDR